MVVLTQGSDSRSHVEEIGGLTVHFVGIPNYNISSWEYRPLIWNGAYCDYMHSGKIQGTIDLIHAHDIDFALPMQFLSRTMKMPMLAHFHVCLRKRAEIGEAHFNLELAHYFQFVMAKAATAVLAVSESEKTHLGCFLDCMDKTFVIPNGIMTDAYHLSPGRKSESRKKLGVTDCFCIFWGGRIGDWMKGPDIVGKAFSKVAAKLKAAVFFVAVVNNSPPENHEYFLSNLSEEARSRTRFFYPNNKEDLLNLFAIADAFVMPSRYEPFGLMGLEAMACGVPVIVSSNCGIAERIHHEQDGLLIDIESPDKSAHVLFRDITRLAEDEELRISLSLNARKIASSFEMNTIADQLIEIYDTVIKKDHSIAHAINNSI